MDCGVTHSLNVMQFDGGVYCMPVINWLRVNVNGLTVRLYVMHTIFAIAVMLIRKNCGFHFTIRDIRRCNIPVVQQLRQPIWSPCRLFYLWG